MPVQVLRDLWVSTALERLINSGDVKALRRRLKDSGLFPELADCQEASIIYFVLPGIYEKGTYGVLNDMFREGAYLKKLKLFCP